MSAWDENSLITDLFVHSDIKSHIISTHVISPQTASDLPLVLDNKSAQRRLAKIIGFLDGRTPRQLEQQQAAINNIWTSFCNRPAEYQKAILGLPSIQRFRDPHLTELPDSTVFALYLCMVNQGNTDANDFVAQTDLASSLNLTTGQRKKMIKAFAAGQDLLREQSDQCAKDFSRICRYLMPEYYMNVDVSQVVDGNR